MNINTNNQIAGSPPPASKMAATSASGIPQNVSIRRDCEHGTAVQLDDALWEKLFPDKEKREAAQASLAKFSEEGKNNRPEYTVDEYGVHTYYTGSSGPIKAIVVNMGEYDSQGFHNVNQLIAVKDMYQLRLPEEAMLEQHLSTGKTTLNMYTSIYDRVGTDTPKNIPANNFIKTGVDRYKELYEQIRGFSDNNVSADHIKRTINELDKAFENYLVEAFTKMGLSEQEAHSASNVFGVAFRTARNAEGSLEGSYTQALSMLHTHKSFLANVR